MAQGIRNRQLSASAVLLFNHIHIDSTGPLTPIKDDNYILTIGDRYNCYSMNNWTDNRIHGEINTDQLNHSHYSIIL